MVVLAVDSMVRPTYNAKETVSKHVQAMHAQSQLTQRSSCQSDRAVLAHLSDGPKDGTVSPEHLIAKDRYHVTYWRL